VRCNIFTKLDVADRAQAIVGCGRRALDVGVVLPHDEVVERTYRSWLSSEQAARTNISPLQSWIIRHPIATFLVLVYATTTALVFVPGR
jgi:hypothetical protein